MEIKEYIGVFKYKHEDISSWDGAVPVEGAALFGASGDKEGNVEYTLGLSAISAAYFAEETVYLSISDVADYVQSSKCNEE